MQWWPDGVEQNEDGPVREIPQRHGAWTSSIWITADGRPRRKWWNPLTRAWHWDAESLPAVWNDTGEGYRQGFHAPTWMSTERLVCMAWRLRSPRSSWALRHLVRVRLLDDETASTVSSDEATIASEVRWVQEEMPDADLQAPLPGETWKPLRWAVGAVPVPKGYRISSHGRLRDPRGRVTHGCWAYGRRWAAVAGAGLVDLHAAAGLDGGAPLPQSIRQARGALLAGATPADLARIVDIEESTAWSYFCRAAAHVAGDELRARVPALVRRDVWRALRMLRGDARLGGSLADLEAWLRRVLPVTSLEGALVMSQVRLARTALTAA